MQLGTLLVLGASGGTGKHFTKRVLAEGRRVRALVRSPNKLPEAHGMDVRQGSITDAVDTDALVEGVDAVVAMVGDTRLQADEPVVAHFVRRLVPSMRTAGVKRFLYQAGGLSRPYGGRLTPLLWSLRQMLPRGYKGQHADNEAVMAYFATEASDIEWIVHRAGIGSDGPSKGVLQRSATEFSVATHIDCAKYSYRLVQDDTADFSCYGR